MYNQFGLVLILNHACNLRCTYCYTGEKLHRPMSIKMGCKAIDRALASLSMCGELELGFFGGEPLIEAELIESLLTYAQRTILSSGRGVRLSANLTTNGTIGTVSAWRVLMNPQVTVAVSCDGLPEIHNRHRLSVDRKETSHAVEATIRRLLDAGRSPRVVLVVRPDTAEFLADGIEYLWNLGVHEFEASLDIWSSWTIDDQHRLRKAIARAAEFWRAKLPEISVGWFDEKAALLTNTVIATSARCGFGAGEIAVSPTGNLYPCERLVTTDESNNAMRLPGNCLDGSDFLNLRAAAGRDDPGCSQCGMQQSCSTTCRCSNFIRTGDVRQPDGLLCDWNQTCVDTVMNLFQPGPTVKKAVRLTLAT